MLGMSAGYWGNGAFIAPSLTATDPEDSEAEGDRRAVHTSRQPGPAR